MAQPLRILLLEDDLSLGQLTMETLDCSGNFETEHVVDADTAIDVLVALPFDLCVLDVNLRNGTCATVVAEANRQGLPVILTSGHHETGSLAEKPRRSMFLQKPVPFSRWGAAVEEMIQEPANMSRQP